MCRGMVELRLPPLTALYSVTACWSVWRRCGLCRLSGHNYDVCPNAAG
ncbi:hypothetical protein A2U01_0114045, partial [Trifolium medium]|nr:hypothetical protein [Trifolium medium]